MQEYVVKDIEITLVLIDGTRIPITPFHIKDTKFGVEIKGGFGEYGRPVTSCVECGAQIREADEMLPDYPTLYQCPVCYHPNGPVAKEDI